MSTPLYRPRVGGVTGTTTVTTGGTAVEVTKPARARGFILYVDARARVHVDDNSTNVTVGAENMGYIGPGIYTFTFGPGDTTIFLAITAAGTLTYDICWVV
jgi:hypothetical protein